jgi:P4 family phage/plasmid primase-like protien
MEFELFLKEHIRPPRRKDIVQTHTCFEVGDRPTMTYSIPDEKISTFLKLYFGYVKSLGTLSGYNCFTEKIRHVFPLFIDIDFDISFYEKGFLTKEKTNEYLNEVMSFMTSFIATTFGQSHTKCYMAKRLFYKVHLHYPDIFVNKEIATSTIHALQSHMNTKYPQLHISITKSNGSTADEILWNKVFDTSVYSSGLRLLLSHKGNLTKSQEEARHRKMFPDEPFAVSYNRLSLLQEDSTLKRISIDDSILTQLSIRRTGDLTPIVDPVMITDVLPPKIARARKVTSTTEERVTASQEPAFTEDDLQAITCEEKILRELFKFLTLRYKETTNEHLTFKDVKRFPNTKYLAVSPVEVEACPIANRLHSRSCSKTPRSATWILVTPMEVVVKCWSSSCNGKTKSLGELPASLRQGLFNMTHLDAVMFKTLHKQSIEHVTEYLFYLLREKHAVVPENEQCTTFSWYTFSASRHRWAKEKRVVLDIMNERGIAQLTMRKFVDKLIKEKSSDGDGSSGSSSSRIERDMGDMEISQKFKKDKGEKSEKDPSEKLESLFRSFESLLQNGNFVQSSLLGILGLKMHLWTVETFGESFSNLLDNKPHVIGFTNGVFDFKERCFRKGQPNDFISLTTKVPYVPYSEQPTDVRESLEESLRKLLPLKEEFDYMLSEIASCLDGTPRSQRYFILSGMGSNGKSTLVKLINFALGDYAGECDVSLFTKPRPPSNAPTEDVFSLRGKRFVVCHEPNERDHLYLGTVKWITGGDRITARALYGHQQSFYLQCTVFMLCNVIPQIRAGQDDYGAWRRLKPREFKCRFVENPSKPNEYPLDPSITDKLLAWKEAFIALLVKYNLKGDGYPVPPAFQEFERQLQENSNHYARFYKDQIRTDAVEYPIPVEDVYKVFNQWLKKEGLDKRVPCHEFARQMAPHLGKELARFVEDENNKKCWNVRLMSLSLY